MFTIKIKCKRVKNAFYDELVIIYGYCRESQKALLVTLTQKLEGKWYTVQLWKIAVCIMSPMEMEIN